MTNGFALWKGDVRDVGWAEISLSADGRLALQHSGRGAEVGLDPVATPYVDVFVADDWLCAVGGSDSVLVIGHQRGPDLEAVVHLERASEGTSCAFERHSLRFHRRAGRDQCVLAWEVGVALIDPRVGLVWTHVHGDVNQRLMAITDSSVELRGLHQAISIDVADGSTRTNELLPPPVGSRDVIAEWMRGIGG